MFSISVNRVLANMKQNIYVTEHTHTDRQVQELFILLLPLLDNCDSTYYNIPSFIGVYGVSVTSITSYTIIIITLEVIYINSACTSIYY